MINNVKQNNQTVMRRYNFCKKCNRYYGRGSYLDKLWHKDFCHVTERREGSA